MKNLFLGKNLLTLVRSYVGSIETNLQWMDIDRYFVILLIIESSDNDLTQQEISNILEVDKVTMVKMIDYLSHHKYVKRVRNTRDKREQFVRLTPKAQKVIDKVVHAFESVNKQAFKGMSPRDVFTFLKGLNLIIQNLSQLSAQEITISIKRKPAKQNASVKQNENNDQIIRKTKKNELLRT